MGIQDFDKVLQECPHAKKEVPASSLSGKRVAIDASNWLFISWMSAVKDVVNNTDVSVEEPSRDSINEKWLVLLCQFVDLWLRNGIVPVFVFDGVAPEEKQATKDKRRNNTNYERQQLEELKKSLEGTSVFEHDESVIERLRRLYRRTIFPGWGQAKYAQNVISSLGLPVLLAKGEGEKLCSCLAISGDAAAVYSRDYDTIVYGTPLLLRQRVYGENTQGQDTFSAVEYESIVNDLDLSRVSFVDLCILLGCDYNTRMYRVGPKTSLKLIREYRVIEALPEKYDVSCLRADDCRRLFSYVQPQELKENEQCLDIDCTAFSQHASSMLAKHGLEKWYTRFAKLLPSEGNALDDM
jgi:flap endonuclease-1